MGPRLHILFLSSWYPSAVHPTLGNFVQRHAEAVSTMHDVRVLYLAQRNEQSVPVQIVDTIESGIPHTRVYYRRGTLKAFSRFQAFRAGLAHLKAQGNLDPDIIHMNVTWPEGWQAVYVRRLLRIPFVLTEHWTGFLGTARRTLRPRIRMMARWVIRQAACVCPVTEDLARSMQALGLRGKYQVVPNVVDTGLFQLVEKASGTTQFLHVSSLDDHQKNISGLLRVWKAFSEHRKDVHLAIGGDGPWEHFRELAEEMGIRPSSISFFGTLPWSGIADLMQRSHCFVMFSNYENLPCVIVESLASGMAVISTDVGGIREHIQSERGILIPPGDEAALEKALARMADDPGQYAPSALRSYAEAHFSMASVAAAYDRVYRTALHLEP